MDCDIFFQSLPEAVKIIVSRSHKGEVEKVAEDAFGASSVITGAGGAGWYIFLSMINYTFLHLFQTLHHVINFVQITTHKIPDSRKFHLNIMTV